MTMQETYETCLAQLRNVGCHFDVLEGLHTCYDRYGSVVFASSDQHINVIRSHQIVFGLARGLLRDTPNPTLYHFDAQSGSITVLMGEFSVTMNLSPNNLNVIGLDLSKGTTVFTTGATREQKQG
jgi:hypothetical protein